MDGMRKAQYLRLQMNGLFGSLHKEITHMGKLKELYLFGNFFAGMSASTLKLLLRCFNVCAMYFLCFVLFLFTYIAFNCFRDYPERIVEIKETRNYRSVC